VAAAAHDRASPRRPWPSQDTASPSRSSSVRNWSRGQRASAGRPGSYGTLISRSTPGIRHLTFFALVHNDYYAGGFSNFLSIYNFLITGRILLSWFPQAQGIAALSPLYAVTDPFLNLFRGVIPPIFGLDLSPIAAFFLLNLLTNATAAIGCEIPAGFKPTSSAFYRQHSSQKRMAFCDRFFSRERSQRNEQRLSLNY